MVAATNIENNKLLACKFFELISEGKLEEICELISGDWNMHTGLHSLKFPLGPEGMRKLFESFGRLKQHWTIEDVIAEGNKVVVRATNQCVQETFLGVPSHGRPQTFTATFIHEIIDGKIRETWRNADDLGRVLQLKASIIPGNAA